MALAQNKRIKAKPDLVLFLIIFALVVWGFFTMSAASFSAALLENRNPWYFLTHQGALLAGGIVLGLVAYKIPLAKLKKMSPVIFLACLALLLAVFLPGIGVESGGARRWMRAIGGFSLQPAEFLKIGFILYLAAWLNEKFKNKKGKISLKDILPFFAVLAVLTFALIKQPNMSTLAIVYLTGFAMYLLTSAPWWHFVGLVGAGGGAIAVFISSAHYRINRFLTFLNPNSDPLNKGYQLKQAAIAIGSGKLVGVGGGLNFGLSRQKLGFLPEVLTDSIFAVVAEEMGFLGCIALICLFMAFAWRCLRLAARCGKTFEGFLACGIAVWITLQALFNMAGITGSLPLGGIPLPFFSYGGSHIIAEMIGVGLLLNISKHNNS
ncbi:MAG: putative lipid II flippase FtsW [Patescibacteria group bacterium]|nr:putative lipid II flippase FtsW [Patescibacteria group bacterium]